MGTPEFAVPSMKVLIKDPDVELVGVFTQPDRPKGRGNKLTPSPVKAAALEAGIPVFQPEKIRKTGVETLRGLNPDLCVTAAFGQILSKELLEIPVLGNINVHASLLPKHRGSAPIAHAIISGDRETGITTMMMDEGIDTGDILLQEQTEIGETETCAELTVRLSLLGAKTLRKTLDALAAGKLRRIPQNHAEMTYDPMLKKETGLTDFSDSAERIKGLINGLNPWPCVSIPCGDGRLKFLRASLADREGNPGNILEADPRSGLVIACGEGAVRILEVQAPGGKSMKAEDYLRGHKLL